MTKARGAGMLSTQPPFPVRCFFSVSARLMAGYRKNAVLPDPVWRIKIFFGFV